MAEEWKARGNASFASKKYDEAIENYDKGLAAQPNDYMTATLLTNRAAAFLNVQEFSKAREDCVRALDLDPSREKALFRKAQAHEGLGETAKAFQAFKELLHRDPTNRSAIVAARRCKEQLARETGDQTPVIIAIKRLRDAGPAAAITNHTTTLRAIISLTHDDASAAMSALRDGAWATIWELCHSGDAQEASLAVRALASMSSHATVASSVNAATPDISEIATLVKGPSARARSAVALMLNLLTRGAKPAAPEGLTEKLESERYAAAVEAWAYAVAHDDLETRNIGLEAVVHWCSESPPPWASHQSSSEHVPFQERKERGASEKRWKAVLGARAEAICTSPAAMSMFCLLDSDELTERQKALAAFGRLVVSFDNKERLKELLEPLVAFGSDLNFMRRRVALNSALFLADGDLGVWMLEKDGAVRMCMNLIASGDAVGQALAAETLCLAASNETARCHLTPVVEAGTLEALLDSSNTRARSAAASAIAKLGLASKALTSSSPDTGRLLNTAMILLKGVDVGQDRKSPGEGAKAPGSENRADGTSTTVERAVEVLAALITRSAIKDEIAHGSGRCAQALSRICAACSDGRGAAAYGLAHIFASLSVTNKEVQERQLAEKEMEISAEQLAELQRITKQKSADEDDDDTKEKASWRIRKIVQCDGIRALVRLADGASEKTKEQIALALRQCAVEPSIRGSIVQQGGYRVCIDFASNPEASQKCARDASWCLGKTLATTNPAILTASQRMGCIAPMLRICKDFRANDLTHFEILLGLTNVVSLGEETKARVASENGIRTLEYLQFSDHELVRRAATECMTNLMPHQSMIEHLRDPEKMKLWCAFAEDFESDLPTSRAAAGTLAMAAGATDDEELMQTMLQSRAIEVFVSLVESGSVELCHRACVGISYLSEVPNALEQLNAQGAQEALRKLIGTSDEQFAVAVRAASTALGALQQQPDGSTGQPE